MTLETALIEVSHVFESKFGFHTAVKGICCTQLILFRLPNHFLLIYYQKTSQGWDETLCISPRFFDIITRNYSDFIGWISYLRTLYRLRSQSAPPTIGWVAGWRVGVLNKKRTKITETGVESRDFKVWLLNWLVTVATLIQFNFSFRLRLRRGSGWAGLGIG